MASDAACEVHHIKYRAVELRSLSMTTSGWTGLSRISNVFSLLGKSEYAAQWDKRLTRSCTAWRSAVIRFAPFKSRAPCCFVTPP